MTDNIFKSINIGKLIKARVEELKIENERLCNFLNCSEKDLELVYNSDTIDSGNLLRWSKILNYDFFRVYTQHLILYSPAHNSHINSETDKASEVLPSFRKHIYSKEVIDFIINQIESKEMSTNQVIQEYGIPKTTLFKWLKKYKK